MLQSLTPSGAECQPAEHPGLLDFGPEDLFLSLTEQFHQEECVSLSDVNLSTKNKRVFHIFVNIQMTFIRYHECRSLSNIIEYHTLV